MTITHDTLDLIGQGSMNPQGESDMWDSLTPHSLLSGRCQRKSDQSDVDI